MALTDEELEALLDELEEGLREDVDAALILTARGFATEIGRSTELVAAAFSVSRIGDMWRRRVSGLVSRVRRIAGRGAQEAAESVDEPVPDASELDAALDDYLTEVTTRLNGVGDRLAEAARTSLAEGVSAGETHAQLQQRMRDLFKLSGTQLGEARAERIARTEATAAFNAGVMAAAESMSGEDKPLVKQWMTRRDARVREAHADADGQLQLIADPFQVGGVEMRFPGDPLGPADLTINCRCIMKTAAAPRGSTEGDGMADDGEALSAAATEHTGAMVALVPSEADAARLALEGGEPVGELHLTLRYLGDAADWSENQRDEMRAAAERAAGWLTPIEANAFGVAQWNPHGDEPAWVYNIGDLDPQTDKVRLQDAFFELGYQLADGSLPTAVNFTPWSPHVCAVYNTADFRGDMVERTGPVTFDRLRVAFGGHVTDYPLSGGVQQYEDEDAYLDDEDAPMNEAPPVVEWSTPHDTALAFENQQTGDGRVFAPGALFWDGDGPWPLQYADEMRGGHDGAQLAGAIQGMGRDGDRLAGHGVLYLTQPAGLDAAMLLAQGAPLGVSVDLDDVDLEFVANNPDLLEEAGDAPAVYRAKMLRASVLATEDGGWLLSGETAPDLAASQSGAVVTARMVTMQVTADGTVPADAVRLTAAAGDPDKPDAVVLSGERSGDMVVRITRGRVRGATLVAMPAYANARIVLADTAMFASVTEDEVTAAIKSDTDYDRILRHVRSSRVPVGAARVAQRLKMPVSAAQRLLAQAAQRGEVVRLCRGLYTDKTTSAAADHVMYDDLTAAVTGAINLPVAARDMTWDGDAAKGRVFEWADGDAGKISRAFAYRDDEADPATKAAYKLGYADVLDDVLTIVPAGVSAAIGAVNGARGGVDIPAEELDKVADHLERVRAHVSEALNDSDDSMQASAWQAMGDMPPMPAAWFREPTAEELPPGGPGVNYSNGRVYGWVAQAGEPHAGFAKKITIDGLGKIDTRHFLRQRFTLDDGSTVKAGAYTMNVGHHRDGAECETSACQFDDTRTVAGIVTVGMNERGMWFSGAAAPWLSEWDRKIFAATQPSYHLKKAPGGGGWQLRAVLGVPVPGHSSPLLASAVIERAQVALTAAATMVEVEEAVAAEEARQAAVQPVDAPVATAPLEVVASIDYDQLADALVAAQDRAEAKRKAEATELAELVAMAGTLDVDTTGPEGA